ncbi:GlsB/YeaQ/YmgE family stress response membrane protein [Peptoniphilus sp.]|uniref:GlsB/YeaQ/YmgE family stress response membrane protein n=1 Tax=Peptoniphilus sp. TaxID=1971214 RepID=UPI00399557A0
MIWSIIVGGVAGWIASIIMNKNESMGMLKNIIVGIIGGSLGRFVLGLLNIQQGEGTVASLAVGVFGAVILLAIVNAITGRK